MMEKITTEESAAVIASPEACLDCDCRQISLSNKNHELVNRNGIIDRHVGKKPNDVFANNEERLLNCSSDLGFMAGEQSVTFQSDYVENSIISSSTKHENGNSSSEPIDGIEIKAKEPTDFNSTRSPKMTFNEVTETSEDEIRDNTEIASALFSKLVIKDNEQDKEIVFVQYKSEDQLPDLVALITVDLSEPYSVYTYRYFLHNWPHLSHLAYHGNQCVGAIVCKLDIHRKNVLRGYIAMLVVHKSYRRWKIGSSLVRKAVAKMINHGCEEVVLETEVTNRAALKLYENLGFVRDKRLLRYYLNGVDAWRLKLWLK